MYSIFTSRVSLMCLVTLNILLWTYFCFVRSRFPEVKLPTYPEIENLGNKHPAAISFAFQEKVAIVTVVGPNSTTLTNYDQKDPILIDYVGHHYITEPSTLPYTFKNSKPNGIVQTIWPILKKVVGASNSKPGFFVEAGAYDGVAASNTVWLERVHGWSGLLVECHPEVVPLLRQKHRKAYISDACLSTSSNPTTAELTSVNGWHPSSSLGSARHIFPDFAKSFTKFKVQTIPLYTLLAAINVTTVDFISLDIQSMEYEVLKYFPFDLILVKVWLIEDDLMSPENRLNLKLLMKQHGYSGPSHPSGSDQFYIHKSIEHRLD